MANNPFDEVFGNPERLTEVLSFGPKLAIRIHRAAGVPLAVGRDGKLVYLDPDTLEEITEKEVERRVALLTPDQRCFMA
jgi:hypothetical protein